MLSGIKNDFFLSDQRVADAKLETCLEYIGQEKQRLQNDVSLLHEALSKIRVQDTVRTCFTSMLYLFLVTSCFWSFSRTVIKVIPLVGAGESYHYPPHVSFHLPAVT